MASKAKTGRHNDTASAIKLKPVTNTERRRLRIPSYQYLLP